MIRILYRVLFLLFVLSGALRSSAQEGKSDVGLWTVGSYVADSYIDRASFDSLDVSFEEKQGFGVSFNHFWTEHLSTELSVTTIRADVIRQTVVVEPHEIGELDARTLTAMGQWHFRQGTRFMPYLGAGVAHASGTVDSADERFADSELESEVTWAAAAGLNVRLTDRIALAFEAKKVGPGDVEDDGVSPGIEIDPMLYGSGVRFRF